MRCPKCGTENPEGKIVCRTCGTRLRAAGGGAGQAAFSTRESDDDLRRRVTYDLTRILWVTILVVAVGLGMGLLLK
ncbi:MAG TPA: zinc ribbon domain-containing protein [bacterium]|nr:zinc ribbon domain-containing protein [bacterium]